MLLSTLTALASITVLGAPVDTTLRLERGMTVEVSSFSQPIMITGTSGDMLSVRGATVGVGRRRVDIDAPMFGPGNKGPITIQLPTWARLVVSAISGPVTVVNAPEFVEVDAVDGMINISGGRGEMVLSATGEITVTDFAGTRLAIDGLAGNITVRGATGILGIESVNGSITLDRITGRDVQASTVNGPIRWRGDFAADGRYIMQSHNGGVELVVPASLNARIRLETFMGGFSSEIPATITGNDTRRGEPPLDRRITATYGRGQATIDVTTFNGGVHVRRIGGA